MSGKEAAAVAITAALTAGMAKPGPEFDLLAFARENRYRVQNLHAGQAVPPAISMDPRNGAGGYRGDDARWDAIVGQRGYVAMDGANLSVFLFFGSSRGVRSALGKLRVMGARIDQIGDSEIAATVPPAKIEEAIRLIKASRLRPPNCGSF